MQAQIAFGPLRTIAESHSIAIPNSPVDIESVDIDGDGDQDIISAFQGNGWVALYENLGNGIYARPDEVDVKTLVSCVSSADMNADGLADIVAGALTGILRYYINQGDGGFTEVLISNTVTNIHDVLALDIDGDGDTDVLTASEGMGTALFINPGTGVAFWPQVLDPSEARSIKVIDFDDDGDLDILSSKVGYSNSADWYENLGGGLWSSAIPVFAQGGILELADLDGDGDQDVIVANENNGVYWIDNTGAGVFGIASTISTRLDATDISVADGDVDGDIDIMIAHEGSTEKNIYFYENLGSANFAAEVALQADPAGASCLAKSDVNGDGYPDLVGASELNDAIYVYRNEMDKFAEQDFINDLSASSNVDLFDYDGDGDIDLVACANGFFDNDIYWYENVKGVYQPAQFIDTTFNKGELHGRDFDGDGDVDILLRGAYSITWFERLSDGSLGDEKYILQDALGSIWTVATGDIDNDGDLEVFTQTRVPGVLLSDSIVWFEFQGGDFLDKQAIPSTWDLSSTRDIEIADLDGDGMNDVVIGREIKILWYRNLGSGAFSAELSIGASNEGGQEIEVADLDGDGLLDLVAISDYALDHLVWYKNLGSYSFGPKQTLSAYVGFGKALRTADLDNDGDLDVISSSQSQNKTFWHKNLGDGNFTSKKLISEETGGSYSFAIKDINNDGYVDLFAVVGPNLALVWMENILRPDCDEATAPQNPISSVGPTQVQLSWDPVPGSLGCQVSGERISPPGPARTQTFNTPELSSVSFPRAAFLDGSNWEWQVRCACETDPMIIGTPFSVLGNFSIPDSRLAGVTAEISVEPNPVKDMISLQLPLDVSSIQISDALGRVVYEEEISGSNGSAHLEATHLDPGIYFLRVEFEDRSYETVRFFKR